MRQCSLKLKQNIGKYEFYVLTRTSVTSLYDAALFRNFWEANFSCCHMIVIFMVINKCIYCDVSRAVLVINWHSYIFKPTFVKNLLATAFQDKQITYNYITLSANFKISQQKHVCWYIFIFAVKAMSEVESNKLHVNLLQCLGIWIQQLCIYFWSPFQSKSK